MSPNDNSNILKKPFMNKDKAEWDSFSSDLISVMALKKNKLDTVMVDGDLHPSVLRREIREAGLKSGDDDFISQRDALKDEILEELDEEVYHIIKLNIGENDLKNTIERMFGKHKHGHKAYLYLDDLHRVGKNTTRGTALAQDRKDLIEEGMASLSLKSLTTFVESLLNYNSQLVGTPHEMQDSLAVLTILDTIHPFDDNLVRTFKINHESILADVHDTYKKLKTIFEENDRAESSNAKKEAKRALAAQVQTVYFFPVNSRESGCAHVAIDNDFLWSRASRRTR